MNKVVKEENDLWNDQQIVDLDIGNGLMRKALKFNFDDGDVVIHRLLNNWVFNVVKDNKYVFSSNFACPLGNISKSQEIRFKSILNAADIADKNGPELLFKMAFVMEANKKELWNIVPWKFEFKPFDTGNGIMKDSIQYHLHNSKIVIHRDDDCAVWNVFVNKKQILTNNKLFLGRCNIFYELNIHKAVTYAIGKDDYGEYNPQIIEKDLWNDIPAQFTAHFRRSDESNGIILKNENEPRRTEEEIIEITKRFENEKILMERIMKDN